MDKITPRETSLVIGRERLKDLRNRLNISVREVEEYSRRIASTEGNDEYFISNPWLIQVENTESTPSIYKLYSLSVIYRVKFTDLLALYGIDLDRISRLQALLPLPQSHLVQHTVYDGERPIAFPVRFDPGFDLKQTNLFSRMVEIWGEVPLSFIQHLDLRKTLYGFIGLKDNAMYPLLRPGSFVQIDDHQTKIEKASWKSEFERPIYFVELRNGYACSWCELQGKELYLVPHPLSGSSVRRYTHREEAEILGRVTAVAMRLVPHSAELGELPKQLA